MVSPLCPGETRWTNHLEALDTLLSQVMANYAVDADRVYLTGLSMGGAGAWQLAIEYPRRFAALAPICGWGEPLLAGRLKELPVWAFHGARDTVVPVTASERMVTAINNAAGQALLTIYPDANHDSWTVTYANDELYEWF
ncbi:MAG: dienelactone hydrolase family protein [Candidatus Marinimicrobia bacterium]|nr:dienelactone hydrolase family protein [Candidatus Neomarinimicrobiota bacterium]